VALDGSVTGFRVLSRDLQGARSESLSLHWQGVDGSEVCADLTRRCDDLIVRACEHVLAAMSPAESTDVLQSVGLVAVGGYGRRELAPHSDLDLLFLRSPDCSDAVHLFVSRMVRGLWDTGFRLSQSVRTPQECIEFARDDTKGRTALMDARLVVGNEELYAQMQSLFRRFLRSFPVRRFLHDVLAEATGRDSEARTDTVCLLEPNVKKSPGGLRDAQLLGWLAAVRCGTREGLGRGDIAAEDWQTVTAAREFLLRIRNELHGHAEQAQDVLTLEEQVRIADLYGYRDDGAMLGVEQFMRDYYRQTTALHEIVDRCIKGLHIANRSRPMLRRLLDQRLENGLILGPENVRFEAGAVLMPSETALAAMRLFDAARRHRVEVDHESQERIRASMPSSLIDTSLRRQFLRMLEDPAELGTLLRRLHRVRLLERLIPPFQHTRCLIQFNRHHKYTVDEHSIRAVEAAAVRVDDAGPIGQAYQQIRQKGIFHLALLLHDVGKGLADDHCEIGLAIAEEVAGHWLLDDHEREVLKSLVHKHLDMAHTAFRRDLSDPGTLLQFARAVQTPELLRMLYVLTAADTEAVSPGEWTPWKETLLTELYVRTMEILTGEVPLADESSRAEEVRRRLRVNASGCCPSEWLDRHLEALPPVYLLTNEPERIVAHLEIIHGMKSGDVRVASEYFHDTKLSAYTVFSQDDLIPGIFSRIAGALASGGFNIVNAQIVTCANGLIIDTFAGVDNDYSGEPPEGRRMELSERIRDVLLGRRRVEDMVSDRLSPFPRSRRPAAPSPQVAVDNTSSQRFTIVEVFADDRHGLLYDITRTLSESGVSVHTAKISTRSDQVVDVFYVTDGPGGRIDDDVRVESLRQSLLRAIATP